MRRRDRVRRHDRDGAFAGATSRLVVAAGSPPHLWLVTRDLVATISGDSTAAELVHVAESLQRVG